MSIRERGYFCLNMKQQSYAADQHAVGEAWRGVADVRPRALNAALSLSIPLVLLSCPRPSVTEGRAMSV